MTLLHKPSTRSLNRRILNEDGLISAVSKFVGIRVVQFDAISYTEQVQYVLPCLVPRLPVFLTRCQP